MSKRDALSAAMENLIVEWSAYINDELREKYKKDGGTVDSKKIYDAIDTAMGTVRDQIHKIAMDMLSSDPGIPVDNNMDLDITLN